MNSAIGFLLATVGPLLLQSSGTGHNLVPVNSQDHIKMFGDLVAEARLYSEPIKQGSLQVVCLYREDGVLSHAHIIFPSGKVYVASAQDIRQCYPAIDFD